MIRDRADTGTDSGVRRLIEAGSDLAGITSGAALAMILSGSGAEPVAFVAAGSALGSVLREIGARLLGHREQIRVGGTAIWAARMYEERKAAGYDLRDDGWFKERPGGRSIAAEICEGTLLIAQREHEERKLEYYGYLLANLGFEPTIDEYLANWLLQLADELTWSQLVLLAMIGRKDEFILPGITVGDAPISWTPWGLHQQLMDLGYGQRNIIGVPRERPGTKTSERNFTPVPRINLHLPDQQLLGAGALIFPLMQLNRIPADDIGKIIELLQPEDEAGMAHADA